jgi:hypothetical protein
MAIGTVGPPRPNDRDFLLYEEVIDENLTAELSLLC